MGLSHRIASRLFKAAALRRNCLDSSLPLPLRLYWKKNLKSSKTASTSLCSGSFCLGLSLLFHVFALGTRAHVTKEFDWSSLSVIPLLVTSLLCFIWVSQNFSSVMEVACFDSGTFNDYKPFLSRIIAVSKRKLNKMEEMYLQMKNFSLLINQLVFFCLCERVFLSKQPVASFYTLMFFNVFAYCISYIKELIEREDWSMYVSIARGSNVRHLAMSTTKIVLEWTKAITFIITVVFILLVFGLEKGLKNYYPTHMYLIVTGFYFLISEKVFMLLIQSILDLIKFECFENMENLYSPLILKTSQIALSMIFTVICALLGHFRIAFLSVFTNIRIKYREVDDGHWKQLKWELIRLTEYRSARREEILRHDDVCAICLQPMRTARITPCKHLFHADCLVKSLTATSQKCPICKQDLPSLRG